ncbi:MAG TPA: aminotransferase [Acetivibrio sp.]|jgi:dUTP pyrophosphatase|nr:aminotransferase [Acetivibrio sp.]HPT90795.1 aminotransferase [Acetivibrio sp.]
MKNKIDVYIKVEGHGRIPEYASENAAGCDLYATEDMAIRPGETKIMPMDFIVAFPPEIEAQIRPRSGLSLKTDLRIPNGPGTIDSDYRDKVGIILQNTYNIANLPYQIAQNPEILSELKNNYREMELREYLSSRETADIENFEGLDVLNQKIYVDKKGNPFGTIYISRGERIAQMVFCEYKAANFISHPNPQEIGKNRGGGFGHTGV